MTSETMNVCLFLIILGTITVLGEQPGNQQETSINPKAKRYYEPEPCSRIGKCRPRPENPNVWPCPSFICLMNPCPEPQFTVCCCAGDDVIFN